MRLFLLIGLFIPLMTTSIFASDVPEERSDRRQFSRLISDIRTLQAEYYQVVNQAVQETGEQEGATPPNLLAGIMDIRDQFRRSFSHCLLISLRWGWEMPADLSLEDALSRETAKKSHTDEQAAFKPAREIVQARFAENSKIIARNVPLPVIALGRNGSSLEEG